MYSEKIDTIEVAIAGYAEELRNLAKQIIKDILAVQPGAKTINVAYYTESEIVSYDFLGIDGNGYGSALFISDIDCTRENNPVFNMVDEDGDGYEDRYLYDFETTEINYVVRMLNDILTCVKEDGCVHTEMDWI